MSYKSSELAIIIPSNDKENIKTCINSIKNQTKKPGQTIIVFPKQNFFKNKKKLIFSNTGVANQVLQRTHGLSFINKKIKLILQLDDKFYLNKFAVENLVNQWNKVDKNVAGIGIKSKINEFDKINNFKFLKNIILNNSNDPGKVLKNGLNNQFKSKKNIYSVDWLPGGLSSWRLELVPHIINRKFPIIKWSIFEDLIFSYDVKFNKKFDLLMCNNVRAYQIKKKKRNLTIAEYFYRGYEYARMHKAFVYLNKDKLSKIAFFYYNYLSLILGIFYCSLSFNKKLFFYIGKLKGVFADVEKIKVL